ncbi:hypothetical protein SORBI_3003G069100 [Sorghum bicolor]|uniref:Oxaloacetate decarboxylase n=1 Tax=Sorghum bicolor TaxID=4558 RepID=A0A1B6Q1Q7_SORBI|nr:hypothetical protein SORBI_3003G069100 [Sorghum bicolor]
MATSPLASAEACDANAALIMNDFCWPYCEFVTLKIFEDNVLLHEFLEEKKGHGRVLVVDVGGSIRACMRCAVLGGNPAGAEQVNNGWVGVVVNGCIRDVDEKNGCDVGVRALQNSHQVKQEGHRREACPCDLCREPGTRICNGEWLYADSGGILISRSELTVQACPYVICVLLRMYDS